MIRLGIARFIGIEGKYEAIKNSIFNSYYSEKINLFIVGAQKSGTSALHHYLTQHKLILSGKTKEVGYFSRKKLYKKGEEWYNSQYPIKRFKKTPKFAVDSTPEYLYYDQIPKLIHSYNPNAKIIICLRDPISRAYSHWNMYKNFSESSNEVKMRLYNNYFQYSDFPEKLWMKIRNNEWSNFRDCCEEDIESYYKNSLEPEFSLVRRGIYYNQIKRYLDLFNKDQVLILNSQLLYEETLATLKNVYKFLGLKFSENNFSDLTPQHMRKYNERILDNDRNFLRSFYEPHNIKLYQLINKNFDW